jgi:PPOX class probable F420-dependent enzyme
MRRANPYVGPVDIAADQARRRATDARVAHLATVSASGEPHAVPVTFAVDGDTIVVGVDQKPKTSRNLKRLQNIRDNPAVSVLVDHYDDEDWSALWWVRADGTASIVDSGEPASVTARGLLVAKYRQYVDDPPVGPFIVVAVQRWRGWQYAEPAPSPGS